MSDSSSTQTVLWHNAVFRAPAVASARSLPCMQRGGERERERKKVFEIARAISRGKEEERDRAVAAPSGKM